MSYGGIDSMKPILGLLLTAFVLSGCSQPSTSTATGRYRVMVIADTGFTIQGDFEKQCESGQSVSFDVTLEAGYEITSLSYGYYNYQESKLVCDNVTSQLSVVLEATPIGAGNTIDYDLKGSVSESNPYEKIIHRRYDPDIRKRVNTLREAEVQEKDGYSLVGWNTKEDLTGEEISLGSRVTLDAAKSLTLFADWQAWNPATEFATQLKNGNVILTGYLGSAKKVVVPDRIGGRKVTEIAAGAFKNNSSIKTLILNPSLEAIRPLAFENTALESLSFYDRVQIVSDSSFQNCQALSSLQVNALWAPRYTKEWTNCFADKYDRLLLNKGQKQLAFFGGSSICNGLDSGLIDKTFKNKYVVTDLGLSYLINPSLQFQIVSHVLQAGDIFVHAPEDLTEKTTWAEFTDLTWRVLEFNYDLLKGIDVSKQLQTFTSFSGYNADRKDKAATSYNEKSRTYNDYGDLATFRPNTDNTDKGYDILYSATQMKDSVLTDLNTILGGLKAQGMTVYFSFGPANLDGNKMPTADIRLLYETKIRSSLTSVPIISQLEDYLFRGKYFSNTNYHLTTEGALLRTNQLIKDLQKQMAIDGISGT